MERNGREGEREREKKDREKENENGRDEEREPGLTFVPCIYGQPVRPLTRFNPGGVPRTSTKAKALVSITSSDTCFELLTPSTA